MPEIRETRRTMHRAAQRPRRVEGFTLVELLIIMVILGILAAIVVFAVQNMEGSSSVAACKADFKTVETAQEAYRSQVGKSATSLNDLVNQGTSPTGALVGPWLKEPPSSDNGYVIGFDLAPGPTYGDVTVASSKPAHGPDDGNANCAFA